MRVFFSDKSTHWQAETQRNGWPASAKPGILWLLHLGIGLCGSSAFAFWRISVQIESYDLLRRQNYLYLWKLKIQKQEMFLWWKISMDKELDFSFNHSWCSDCFRIFYHYFFAHRGECLGVIDCFFKALDRFCWREFQNFWNILQFYRLYSIQPTAVHILGYFRKLNYEEF